MIFICYLNIKEIRLSKNLTQKELAHKVHISQGYLSVLERNEISKLKGMRFGLILDFAKALNVDVMDIINLNKKIS